MEIARYLKREQTVWKGERNQKRAWERERLLQALMNSKSDLVKTSLLWAIRVTIYL